MLNKDKTHCIHGHEFTSENTRWDKNPNGNPRRRCISCIRSVYAHKGYSNSKKTHCPQGHPYNQENTGVYMNATRYYRFCKICKREKTNYKNQLNRKSRRESYRLGI